MAKQREGMTSGRRWSLGVGLAASLAIAIAAMAGSAGPVADSHPSAAGLQKTRKNKWPTVSLTATATTVAAGGSVSLQWSSTNATACSASGGWSGAQPTAGSRTFTNLGQSQTFTLTCSKKKKSGSASVTVAVTAAPPAEPPGPVTFLDPAATIDAASFATCAVTVSGQAYCWGDNRSAQLGTGDVQRRVTPAASNSGMSFRKVAIAKGGGGFACGLTTDGSVYCWGMRMKLGDGVTAPYPEFSATPVLVAGGRKYIDVALGGDHACAVATDGDAYCWGYNGGGQLGTGDGAASWVPAPVTGGHKFRSISANIISTCAVASDGAAYCWGQNIAPGNGTMEGGNAPALVDGGLLFESISVGLWFVCGVTRDGDGYCWGDNGAGNLGNGTISGSGGPVTRPVKVTGGLKWKSISAAVFLTCGVTIDGVGYCWGGNLSGERGDGTTGTADAAAPVRIAGGLQFGMISADWHVCGVTTDGFAYCWGPADEGALGNGSLQDRNVPTKVAGQK